jgi:serine/threonine-protein kinase
MSPAFDRLAAAVADRYRFERELGQGGMATVYLAEDLKHHRKVAIKVLRPELAAILGAERFLKEIELTANLQHPHILPLFDSGAVALGGGEADAPAILYYVMPFVEGETLRAKLSREKQFGIAEAVRITIEIAGALDYAHRHGVVHRDIKPENVLLHDGRALVADFGIALAVRNAGGTRMTETGLSLGTPGYMSPEQATGDRQLDARSDIYSLGCMLYEMLVGEPPHTGPTVQAVIAAVVTKEPEGVVARRSSVPANVAGAVHQALAKLPADRFETAAEFARALGDPGFTHPTASPAHSLTRATRRAGNPAVLVGLALIALALGALGGWLSRGRAARAAPSLQFYLTSDSLRKIGAAFAISPDGTRLVYYAKTPTGGMLFEQRLTELDPRPIPGTDDAGEDPSDVFFAPDGQTIGFDAGSAIRRVRLDGSELATVTPLASGFAGAAWGPDGSIFYSSVDSGIIHRISANGGPATLLPVHAATGTFFLISPRLLPGGKALLCVNLAAAGGPRIGVLTLVSGQFKSLRPGLSPAYLPSGHLVYGTEDGSVMIQPFDAGRADTTGPASRLAQNVTVYYSVIMSYAVSDPGLLVYLSRRAGEARLAVFARDGSAMRLSGASRFWVPRISPDGRRVVYGAYGTGSSNSADLWTYDLALKTDQRLTSGGQAGRDYNDPTWSPDGRRIAISAVDSGSQGTKNLYLMPSDGSGPPVRLLDRPGDQWPSDWTRDGKYLLFTDTPPSGSRSIWLAPIAGAEAPRPVVKTNYNAQGGRLSPDGRWLAYDSDETGQSEVYVQPFPGPGPRLRVSLAGGQTPVWSRSGKELFYLSRNQLLAVEVKPGAEFAVGTRNMLFQASFAGGVLAPYDVTPDGQRFVVSVTPETSNHLAVVTNFLSGGSR